MFSICAFPKLPYHFVYITKSSGNSEKVEPCSLISFKILTEVDLSHLAFIYTGVTSEVTEDNLSIECTTSKSVVKSKKGWRKFYGILIALLGTFVYSIATLIIKLFHNYHPFVLSIWRFQGMIFPSIPILLFYMYGQKKPVFKNVWPLKEKTNLRAMFLIFLRSLLGCTCTILQIFAVQKLNMADASVIVFSSPVFVALAAHVFLGEKTGFCSILTAVFTLFGVVVITRPPMLTGALFDMETLIGTGYAIGAMLLSVLVFLILRHLREVHYSVVTISYGVLGTLESTVMAAVFQVFDLPHGLSEWALAAGLILCTFLGQTAVILSLKFENAGPVSLVGTTDVIFAFLWQFIFLNVMPDLYSLIGASIVLLGVLLTTFRKWIATLPEDHKTRLQLSWILK